MAITLEIGELSDDFQVNEAICSCVCHTFRICIVFVYVVYIVWQLMINDKQDVKQNILVYHDIAPFTVRLLEK